MGKGHFPHPHPMPSEFLEVDFNQLILLLSLRNCQPTRVTFPSLGLTHATPCGSQLFHLQNNQMASKPCSTLTHPLEKAWRGASYRLSTRGTRWEVLERPLFPLLPLSLWQSHRHPHKHLCTHPLLSILSCSSVTALISWTLHTFWYISA